jgi:hypothetical protein
VLQGDCDSESANALSINVASRLSEQATSGAATNASNGKLQSVEEYVESIWNDESSKFDWASRM